MGILSFLPDVDTIVFQVRLKALQMFVGLDDFIHYYLFSSYKLLD